MVKANNKHKAANGKGKINKIKGMFYNLISHISPKSAQYQQVMSNRRNPYVHIKAIEKIK